MDSRAVVFLEVMAAIAVVGVVSFLIFLVSRQAMRAPGSGRAAGYRPQWYELALAAAALAIVAILLLWRFLPASETAWDESGRALTFFVIMLIIAGGGLAIFLLTMILRVARERPETPAAASPDPVAAAPRQEARASRETPPATRLLGLLGLAVAFLILNWAHVPAVQGHAMMLNLIYPAGLAVALVMLFDKASRAWAVKGPGETLREWLFCNLILVLYLIGYLNLMDATVTEGYGGMFWDLLNVVLFLLVLWVVDRKTTRLRFLLAHAYLIALPILLLIWQTQMGVPADAEVSWWETVWPFFFLGLVFFVLELIILIAATETSGQGAGTFKDVVFLILYVILLIAARPEAVA